MKKLLPLSNVLLGLMVASIIGAAPALAQMTFTVTNTNDSGTGSLRAAINNSNGNPPTAGTSNTINFSLPSPSTITLTSSTLTIGQSVTINGPGASNLFISGNGTFSIFTTNSALGAIISGVTIENGGGPEGGGIFNNGTLTLTNSVVSGNSASSFGGGIFNNAGSLTVTNSTLSDNSVSSFGGGGINNAPGATATVTNSTLSGNSAPTGGGIHSGGTLTVTNSTLSGNSALSGDGAGILNSIGGNLTVKNTLLANNGSGGNCNIAGGTPTSDGHNLSDDTTCSSFFTATGDLNNTPAGLDPAGLQNNGGPTPTIALLVTSLAVDEIPLSFCTAVDGITPITTDQRGVTRPQGPACDIGAYELIDPAFQVRHFVNLNAGDSYINLTNDGSTGGNICVNVYAFDPAEELLACCACNLTPNALQSLSVKTDLLSNTLTPAMPTSVTVKLLATVNPTVVTDPPCNAASPGALAPLEAWGTTIHATPVGTYRTTETPFAVANLSAAELTQITGTCGFIQGNASGYGICKSCQSGGLGAAKQ